MSFFCCIKLHLKEGRVVSEKRWIEIFHYFIQSFSFSFSELPDSKMTGDELISRMKENFPKSPFLGTEIFWVIKMAHAGKNVNRADPFIGKGWFFLF